MWVVEYQGTRGKHGAQETGFLPNVELEWALDQGDREEMVDALDPA